MQVNVKIEKKLISVYLVFLLVTTGFIGLLLFEKIVDSGSVEAAIALYVGGSGTGNYSSIQDAIDNASFGDTIRVYNGTYYENIVVNKTITLIGNGSTNTTINGNGNGDVVQITANWVNVTGFTIMNGTAGVKIDGDTDGRNIITGDGTEHTVFASTSANYANYGATQYNNGRKVTTDGDKLYTVYYRRTSSSSYYQIYK